MAKFNVTGEQDLNIDKQMIEIKRQIRQKGGSPIDPKLVALALQDIVEGKFYIQPPKMKLVARGIEIPELIEEFDSQKYFIENKEVKYCLGGNFKKYVLRTAKIINNLQKMSFSKFQFVVETNNKEIMEHFKIPELVGFLTSEEILRVIAYLTSKQPNGENGILPSNGCNILIGYLFCSDDIVRAVIINWSCGASGWVCSCGDECLYGFGHEMLLRNK